MTGRMIEFEANGATAPGYLATPGSATGPGVVVLHTWWGLTEPFRQACDRLAEAGYVALAPDLYHGKTTDSVEMPIASSLSILEGLHARWTHLMRSLDASAFDRTIQHPERGPMSLNDVLGLYAWHGKHHTTQITQLRERMGW